MQSLCGSQPSDNSCSSNLYEDMVPDLPRSSTSSGEFSERIVNVAKGISLQIPDSLIMPHFFATACPNLNFLNPPGLRVPTPNAAHSSIPKPAGESSMPLPGLATACPKLNYLEPPGLRVPTPNATHLSIPKPAGESSSPITSRIESVPLPGRSIPVAQLNDALRKELAGNTFSSHSNLLERLLPHERLFFPVNEDLLRKLSAPIGTRPPIWNELESSFCQLLTNFGEAAICDWLNNIGTTMGLVSGHQCERLWWSGSCGEPLVDRSVRHKLDVILLDRDYHDRVSQRFCLALNGLSSKLLQWCTEGHMWSWRIRSSRI